MPDQPDPIRALDLAHATADFTHGHVADRHRDLTELGAVDSASTDLLRESASIAIVQIPALLRDLVEAARRWEDESLLDPVRATSTTRFIEQGLAELEPRLNVLRDRHAAIAREMTARVDRAQR